MTNPAAAAPVNFAATAAAAASATAAVNAATAAAAASIEDDDDDDFPAHFSRGVKVSEVSHERSSVLAAAQWRLVSDCYNLRR